MIYDIITIHGFRIFMEVIQLVKPEVDHPWVKWKVLIWWWCDAGDNDGHVYC